MFFGYNTNGLAHHGIADAIAMLADRGYRGVALTIDHGLLNPYADDMRQSLEQVRRLLNRYEMRSVIETGARYLLDPRVKHEPTLMSTDPALRSRRVRFLQQAIDVAVSLGSDCMSFWSGILHEKLSDNAAQNEAAAFDRLIAGLQPVIEHAARRGVVLGFEPEPGMFIDSMTKYQQLLERLGMLDPSLAAQLQLTLDIGHLHCQCEVPIADQIRRWQSRLVNVHLEDMRAGVHEHLMFGDGEIEFAPVLAALAEINYSGGVYVELSRHSHQAAETARRSIEFLTEQL